MMEKRNTDNTHNVSQTSSGQNEEFQRYLVDVANEIDPGRDSELSRECEEEV